MVTKIIQNYGKLSYRWQFNIKDCVQCSISIYSEDLTKHNTEIKGHYLNLQMTKQWIFFLICILGSNKDTGILMQTLLHNILTLC